MRYISTRGKSLMVRTLELDQMKQCHGARSERVQKRSRSVWERHVHFHAYPEDEGLIVRGSLCEY
jgi:hypothetical protein